MNALTPTGPKPEIVKFREQLETRAQELKMALPAHISPEKFQRTVISAVQSEPDLLTADRQSLILACMMAAQDGLLPNKREAAIVLFKENKKVNGAWVQRKVATYMPMVYGLRKKILQSGEVSSLEVGIVYSAELENGDFYYRVGVEPPLGHKPSFNLTEEQTTDDQIIAAYSIATMKDGTKSYEVMRRFEINKVRECSQTGATRDRKGQPRQPSGPWVEWFAEQAKKTVMRRHSKVLPMTGDVLLDVEGRELEAGMSAAALLASQPGGQPQAIEDHTDDPHDLETGEGIEAQASEPDKPDDDQDAVSQVNDTADEQPATLLDAVDQGQGDETAGKDPAAGKANEIIDQIKAAISTMDIDALMVANAKHLEAMGTDLADSIERIAEARKAEIVAARAKAKEAAE